MDSQHDANRTQALVIMDELEHLVLRRGWPIPFSAYYLVNHQRMLELLDQLRAHLQDDLDERFIQAFGLQQDNNGPSQTDNQNQPASRQ